MEALHRTTFAASKHAELRLFQFLRRSSERKINTSCIRSAIPSKSTKSTLPKSLNKPQLQYKTPTRKPPSNTTSSSSPSATKSTPPKTNPLKNRSIPIVLGSITLFALSSYSTYLYISLTRAPPSNVPTTAALQRDVSSTYDDIASTFDSHVDLTETSMGITALRRDLAARAWGDVLEVSIGTGRNLQYYNWPASFSGKNVAGSTDVGRGRVRSFTAIDKSKEMLEIAHDKFSTLFPGILGVRWIIGDASRPGTIPPPPRNANERSGGIEGKKYDTIIQTMGLCSVADPVALLRNLGEHVVEEQGRILLLEHGRARWEWLNKVLDRGAEEHAKRFGCWWNRDFEEVLRESGLVVVDVQRPKWWHGGTTWMIELKKVTNPPA